MNIIWSPEALADLEVAVDYLAERSPPAAEWLATGIVAARQRGSAGSSVGQWSFGKRATDGGRTTRRDLRGLRQCVVKLATLEPSDEPPSE